jgi:UDPglucose 6-dehydrogenase
MNIGFVGVGRLGLPCAVAVAMKGHAVTAYDTVPSLMNRNHRSHTEIGPDGTGLFDPTSRAEICASAHWTKW